MRLLLVPKNKLMPLRALPKALPGLTVDRMNLQAGDLAESVKQTSRLAKATATANRNVIEADRPWMGASLSVADFGSGKTPTYTVIFVNSGKRPARVTLTQALADFKDSSQFPPYDVTPSVVGLSFPTSRSGLRGRATIRSRRSSGGVSAPMRFLFGCTPELITGICGTNARYWTHVCWRYTPTHTAINGDFSNCSEYNEAK
jgi:hypothetical protein